MKHDKKWKTEGYKIINTVYSTSELESIYHYLNRFVQDNRNRENLYAIRNVLTALPELTPLLFTDNLKSLIESFGDGYFLVKSIYFDKPPKSNWFVAWHQDITVSVKEKKPAEGFSNWTEKEGAFSVQPPVNILENIITVRIHLDNTNEANGALRVLPLSHLNGVVRIENQTFQNEISCNVNSGGVMLMKPLLFHSSRRTTNNKRRRVIHLEFCNKTLPNGLQWAETH